MKTGVKIALLVGGALAIGGLIYWISRKKPIPPKGNPIVPGTPDSPQLTPTPTQTYNPAFPLKSGSNNSYVKQLQTALGVTADGSFGPATLSALQMDFGLSSVATPGQLNQIISEEQIIAQNVGLALNRVQTFQAGGVCITVNQDAFCPQVQVDASGNVTPTGLGITLSAGHFYDNSAYILQGSTKMGQCLMQVIASDGTAGEYTVDPNAIFLVQQPASTTPISITPSVDSSGLLTGI